MALDFFFFFVCVWGWRGSVNKNDEVGAMSLDYLPSGYRKHFCTRHFDFCTQYEFRLVFNNIVAVAA